MVRVKIFTGTNYGLENQINEWLSRLSNDQNNVYQISSITPFNDNRGVELSVIILYEINEK